jgi:glutaredoxin 3
MAKALLKQKDIEFEERKIGAGWTIEQLLESVPNVKSVPQIILNGKYIGGYQELKTHFETEGK